MKKILNKIYLLILAITFSASGYFIGSKDQKVDIALPRVEASTLSQNSIDTTSANKTAKSTATAKPKIIPTSSNPVQNTVAQTVQPSIPTPTQNPASVTTSTPIPTPKTTVS